MMSCQSLDLSFHAGSECFPEAPSKSSVTGPHRLYLQLGSSVALRGLPQGATESWEVQDPHALARAKMRKVHRVLMNRTIRDI